MPIVSEHPRSIDVIRRLSDECDQELERFVTDYTKRRREYLEESEARRKVVDDLEDDDRAELSWRELCTLLRAREAAAEQLCDELELMTKELTLLKREMRRVRRKLLDGTGREEPEYEPERPSSPELPNFMPSRDGARASSGRFMDVLKPWLRSFLPGSA